MKFFRLFINPANSVFVNLDVKFSTLSIKSLYKLRRLTSLFHAPAGHLIQTLKVSQIYFSIKEPWQRREALTEGFETKRCSGSIIKTREGEVGRRYREESDRAPDYRYQQFNSV